MRQADAGEDNHVGKNMVRINIGTNVQDTKHVAQVRAVNTSHIKC